MKLDPYRQVDATLFSASPEEIRHRDGAPLKALRNSIGLHELDYGSVVYRFQDSGRLEEVTRRAPVLYLGPIDVPFGALEAYVHGHDASAFERAGFVVSPRFGLAFDPRCPDWVTALAAHCIETWRAL